MTLLLDTHVWIWAQEKPEQLGARTRAAVESLNNGLFVSAVAALEIARLVFLRRLHLDEPASRWINDSIRALAAHTIDVTARIAAEAYELPGSFHKDPADRLIVATARLHDLTLVTADESILRYRYVKTFRASA